MEESESVRLVLDLTRCDGCGGCAAMCPERISLGLTGFADIDTRPISDAESVQRAAWAIWSCPRSALSLSP